MHAPTALALLEIWERGRQASDVERGLLLLSAALPGVPREALRSLPVGRRDARLMALRRWVFGSAVEGVTDCPSCGERLELAFDLDGLLAGEGGGFEDDGPRTLRLERDGWSLIYRLPDSGDLDAVARAPTAEGGALLLRRCLLEARSPGGVEVLPEALPPELVGALAGAMEAADPQGTVLLASECPSCGHQWNTLFDILAWFWAEIEGWGHRTLRDVHTLARAYGWSEAEVLGLSPWRRRAYLELVGG